VNKENYSAAVVIMHIILSFCCHFKSEIWSEKLLKYSVRIMGKLVAKEGTVASELPK